jgi:hypothetical protein
MQSYRWPILHISGALDDLWGHILRSATHSAHSISAALGQAKVCNLDAGDVIRGGKEEVLQLQVSVTHIPVTPCQEIRSCIRAVQCLCTDHPIGVVQEHRLATFAIRWTKRGGRKSLARC